MPGSYEPSERGPPAGPPGVVNARAMIYVPPGLHQAMKQLALDEGRSMSAVYGEAARAYLAGRGVVIEAPPKAEGAPRPSGMAELAEAIDRQGRRIEELRASIDAVRGDPLRGGPAPAGTKAADAMKVVLGIVRGAGTAGIASRDLETAWRAAGLRSGTAETAKSVLRAAGLVRCERRR